MVPRPGVVCAIVFPCLQRAAFACALSFPSSNHSVLGFTISPRHIASVTPRFDWQQIVTGVDHYVKSVLSRANSNDGSCCEDVEAPNILDEFPTAQDLNLSVNIADSGRAVRPELLLTSP